MKRLLYRFFLLLFGTALISSCDISPVDIEYNADQCHACKMTIADSRFGAELVTKKGKIYKFDAAECLVPELNEKGENLYEFVMVTDFNSPKNLIDAKTASFLISKKLPSPMGGNLSAYDSKAAGEAALKKHGGKLYTWEELKMHERFTE